MPLSPVNKDMLTRLHTIDEPIVSDGLKAASAFGAPYAVGGGMAVQSYSEPEFYRPTSDIDFVVGIPITFQGFRQLASMMLQRLEESGYDAKSGKSRRTYDVEISKSDFGKLYMQFKRRSAHESETNKMSIEREVSNANDVEKNGVKCKVIRPEDVILHKIARIYAYDLESNEAILIPFHNTTSFISHVIKMRDKAIETLDAGIVEEYRRQADLFDINVLLACTQFDEKYFRDGLKYFSRLAANEKYILEDISSILEKRRQNTRKSE